MEPRAPQTPYGLLPATTCGKDVLPVLMFWLTNRTEPSQNRALTPPGWLLLAERTPPVESALPLLSFTHEGLLGARTVLNATFSAWPSHQIEPNLDLTWTPLYWPRAAVELHEPGLLMTDGKLETVAVLTSSPLAERGE